MEKLQRRIMISLGNQTLINKILANCYELYEVIATIKQKKRFTVKKINFITVIKYYMYYTIGYRKEKEKETFF